MRNCNTNIFLLTQHNLSYCYLSAMKLFFVIIIGFFVFIVVDNFFYIDVLNGCFIKILPSIDLEFNQYKVKQGLVILKNALPDDYKNVCKRIGTIDPNLDCGLSEGGCYWPGDPKRISVSTSNTTLNWVAGVIVHETCHSIQDSDHRPFSELECHHEDDRVLKGLSIYK